MNKKKSIIFTVYFFVSILILSGLLKILMAPVVWNKFYLRFITFIIFICTAIFCYITMQDYYSSFTKIFDRLGRFRGIFKKLFTYLVIIFFATAVIRLSFGVVNPVAYVKGHSMEPTMSRGDVAIVREVYDYNNISEGDLIAFYNPNNENMRVIHRVKKTIKNKEIESWDMEAYDDNIYWITKGDNNPTRDSWLLAKDNIIGRVLMDIPKAGLIPLKIGKKGQALKAFINDD